MTLPEAIQTLQDYQDWRIGGKGEMPHPKKITEAINIAIHLLNQMQNE